MCFGVVVSGVSLVLPVVGTAASSLDRYPQLDVHLGPGGEILALLDVWSCPTSSPCPHVPHSGLLLCALMKVGSRQGRVGFLDKTLTRVRIWVNPSFSNYVPQF